MTTATSATPHFSKTGSFSAALKMIVHLFEMSIMKSGGLTCENGCLTLTPRDL